ARGARIYAELAGYGTNCDAYHMTAPHPQGEGATKAMAMAIAEAGLSPQDIGYINAHGTSTPHNDATETIAIKNLFGEHAYKLLISSTKSMTGHLLGATGAVESVAAVMAIVDGAAPPTIGFKEADPDCDLNYTFNTAVERGITVSLNNSFGFGGHNAVLCFKKFK
ncbi:MAG: beta-ketoacyl-[acyl-carrier-protein] synthase II, partial [Defluviitaleaceae bacterium]|nr:beta-ketoacyl-[acyl-carrier-protein] synthase II [Defluviitaleaceae bacterium]